MNKTETQIADHIASIMNLLKIPMDDSTEKTPQRVARMYSRELFKGLSDPDPQMMAVKNKFNYDQMIIIDNIKVHSCCEHHLIPFMGSATIAYFPKDLILGLSKFNRLVDHFARRPQIQERLTMQIHKFLSDNLGTPDIAVKIKAEHLCVKLRGIKDQGSITTTSMLTGKFRDNPTVKSEFLSLSK